MPFTLNAVAAKGPMLGRQDVGMALVEATDGKGRIILSQLEATACRKLDSVAATYLYNLIDYAAGADYWKGAAAAGRCGRPRLHGGQGESRFHRPRRKSERPVQGRSRQ